MFCWISFAHFFFAQPARFGDARSLEFGVAQADVRVKAAAGSGHGIGGNGSFRRKTILCAIGGDMRSLMASFNFCEVGPRLLPPELAAS